LTRSRLLWEKSFWWVENQHLFLSGGKPWVPSWIFVYIFRW
jgi:hypothetical protein